MTGINEEIILEGQYTKEIRTRLSQAVEIIEKYGDNIVVVHMPDPTIDQVRAKVRYHYFHDNIQYMFYDYIFSSPGLLNEYRDLGIREDVILNIFSTALKNIAVELGMFVMTATQLNDTNNDAGKRKELKNQSSIRGSKAIIDKADVGAIGTTVSSDEIQMLQDLHIPYNIVPNQVLDIYKLRRGRYNGVRIWSFFDLGTCRLTDLFVTDAKYQLIPGFQTMDFRFECNENNAYAEEIEKLNKQYQEKVFDVKIDNDGVVTENKPAESNTTEDNIDWSAMF